MTLEEAVVKAGSAKKLAEKLGVQPANISHWRKSRNVPKKHQAKLDDPSFWG